MGGGLLVIVTTRDRIRNKPGPRFLADLRNGYIYIDENDEWVKVFLKSEGESLALEQGKPFPIQDRFGLLDELIIVDATQYYNGPHPEGKVRCACGVMRNEEGFCPRCHDEICHICGKSLHVQNVASGEGLPPRKLLLCNEPSHNPTPIPHWRTKPIEGEALPARKPKKWPDKFKELPISSKKVINDFFGNLIGVDRLDWANWIDECMIHRLPRFAYEFKEVRTFYKDDGPLK